MSQQCHISVTANLGMGPANNDEAPTGSKRSRYGSKQIDLLQFWSISQVVDLHLKTRLLLLPTQYCDTNEAESLYVFASHFEFFCVLFVFATLEFFCVCYS